ncbi:MAG TPA: FliM/FliN family flagellar motor switch protein, partial [Hyphomonas sp.]|nr:FliM/FliN family flagellar motor switch protein [Hyphomonas sp.]
MTRTSVLFDAAPLPMGSADDEWDMSPRREGQVMSDLPPPAEPADPERFLMTARGKLTPAEIEALLRPDLSDMGPEPAPRSALPADRALGDFSAPAATPAPDTGIARRLAARLSMALRESCGLPVALQPGDVQQLPFETAVRLAGDERGQAIVCFAQPEGDIGAMLILPPGFAQLLIETACGARTRSGAPKPLSPIDLALLEALVRPLGTSISADLVFAGVETETLYAASISPPATALAAPLTFRAQTESFTGSLILSEALAGIALTPDTAAPALPATPQGALSTVVTARLASLSVPLSKLSGLKPGATLLLGVPADQPVELLSGGTDGPLVAEAEIGRRGGRIALRITRRGP